MALSIPRLAGTIFAAISALYSYDFDDEQQADPNYFLQEWSLRLATAIINEITGNAKCSGNDSHGDTHDDVGII